ncbi:Spx/MgsR family RNA polymerase-binding regulatory protein [Peptacetobacter sp.]|uniref:Spx/MgsR family RNA polymerase-binding regulatory protein n=1 Tax=Peptacetobacter sp. TaxID=2991975 RepID=UPI002ED4CB40
MKKAKAWLLENNIEFEEVDVVKETPTKEEIEDMYKRSGLEIKKFFNSSGKKYRELNLKDVVKVESDDKLLDILSSDGMLIKRPIFDAGKIVLIGFKEEAWKEALISK